MGGGMNARGSLIRPMCGCGNKAISTGIDPQGRQNYKNRCRTCIRRAQSLKKAFCEKCGARPESSRDLHADHIDMDPSNNSPSNVQTLCVRCHVLKTNLEKKIKRGLVNA